MNPLVIHWTGRWMGPSWSGYFRDKKHLPCLYWDSSPRSSSPQNSHYTNYSMQLPFHTHTHTHTHSIQEYKYIKRATTKCIKWNPSQNSQQAVLYHMWLPDIHTFHSSEAPLWLLALSTNLSHVCENGPCPKSWHRPATSRHNFSSSLIIFLLLLFRLSASTSFPARWQTL